MLLQKELPLFSLFPHGSTVKSNQTKIETSRQLSFIAIIAYPGAVMIHTKRSRANRVYPQPIT